LIGVGFLPRPIAHTAINSTSSIHRQLAFAHAQMASLSRLCVAGCGFRNTSATGSKPGEMLGFADGDGGVGGSAGEPKAGPPGAPPLVLTGDKTGCGPDDFFEALLAPIVFGFWLCCSAFIFLMFAIVLRVAGYVLRVACAYFFQHPDGKHYAHNHHQCQHTIHRQAVYIN